MPQIFRPRANALARWILVLAALGSASAVAGGAMFVRSSFYTGTHRPIAQPIPFSHQHHAGDLGIDCRYCHTSVETSSFAGVPASEVCMTCHSQIWTSADVLAPLRDSLAKGTPIHWNRVNDLGDFVYFNHAIHVNKGVACVTCHGPVDRMPLTWRQNPMQMEWCLGCHRDPAPSLVAPDKVFDPAAQPAATTATEHSALLQRYGIKPDELTDCYVCHR